MIVIVHKLLMVIRVTTTKICFSLFHRVYQGRVAMIIGHCNYCKSDFCGSHRLPEAHQCQAMSTCREQAFQLNAQRLEASKCVAAKV